MKLKVTVIIHNQWDSDSERFYKNETAHWITCVYSLVMGDNYLELVEVEITTIHAWLYEINDTVRSFDIIDEQFFKQLQARLEFIGQAVQALQTFCKSEKESQSYSCHVSNSAAR